jgi:multiple sugar transport system permease protein
MSYRRNRPGVLSIAIIVLSAVFVILPLYWVVITSIKPSDDYLATPPVFFPTLRRCCTTQRHCLPIGG